MSFHVTDVTFQDWQKESDFARKLRRLSARELHEAEGWRSEWFQMHFQMHWNVYFESICCGTSLDNLKQYNTIQDSRPRVQSLSGGWRDLSEVDVQCTFVHICPGGFHSFRWLGLCVHANSFPAALQAWNQEFRGLTATRSAKKTQCKYRKGLQFFLQWQQIGRECGADKCASQSWWCSRPQICMPLMHSTGWHLLMWESQRLTLNYQNHLATRRRNWPWSWLKAWEGTLRAWEVMCLSQKEALNENVCGSYTGFSS